MKQNVFHFVSMGFLIGIIFSSYIKLGGYFLLFLILISVGALVFLISREVKSLYPSKNKFLMLIIIAFISFVLGIIRINFAENALTESPFKEYDEKYVSLIGIVIDEPQRKNELLVFRLKTFAVTEGQDPKLIKPTYILLRVPFFNNVNYGQKIIVSGKIEVIKNFLNADENLFDYVSYLKKDKVAYQIQRPKIEIVEENNGNPIKQVSLFVKEKFVENIGSRLSEPGASLVSGMVISGKQSLDKDLEDAFIKAGIIHVVVLSGYNIAIVVSVLFWLFSFTGRKIRLVIVCVGLFIFVLMSGASAPVVRSAIMALIILFAKFGGRQISVSRILLLTAFLMVFWNPHILVFDSSFQLSFLATFAIIYISPILKDRLSWVTEKYKFREIVSDTLAAQIFLLPFLIYKMGIVSIVALPVNIIILPLIPWVMFLGFVIGVFGFIPFITIPFALVSHLLIQAILFVVQIFISIPFASLSVKNISIFVPIIMYVFFLVYIYRLKASNISV